MPEEEAKKKEKEEITAKPAPSDAEAAATSGKRRLWPWLLLALLLAAAAAAAILVRQQPPWLHAMLEKPVAAPRPAAQTPPQPPAEAAVSKDDAFASLQHEVAQLRDRLHKVEAGRLAQLEQRLGAVEAEQQRRRQAALAMQRLNLRMLLARIADADSSAAAMRLAWHQIALLPLLTAQERDRASKLGRRAEKLAADIASWREALHQLAAALPLTEAQGAAAVPKWLKPFAPYFRISPAPSRAQALERLHTQLLQSSHLLALGLWPDAASWRRLRKQAAVLGDEKAAAMLPEDFTEARLTQQQLRQAAADWLETL